MSFVTYSHVTTGSRVRQRQVYNALKAVRGGHFDEQVMKDQDYTTAVVTLVPTAGQAETLALPGGIPADTLHVTMAFLGEADEAAMSREEVVERLSIDWPGPVTADAFAHGVFNPDDPEREPATVLLLQSEEFAQLRPHIVELVGDESGFPIWVPHMTLGYNLTDVDKEELVQRTGPITFDRIAVMWGGDITHIPLTSDPENA